MEEFHFPPCSAERRLTRRSNSIIPDETRERIPEEMGRGLMFLGYEGEVTWDGAQKGDTRT